jgi:cobalt-zinc-cadmium efflux system outer membrane protein
VRVAVAETYQALSTAVSEIDALKATVIPGAQSAFDAASEGYRQGKFGYLDVLDAQRTLFEARGQYISALATYHKAVADMERAIGRLPDGAGQLPDPKRGATQ